MNKISLYIKHPLKSISIASCQLQVRLKSSNKQDKDDKSQDTQEKKVKNKEALDKLNLLLTQIVQEDAVTGTSKLELAKPRPKRIDKKEVEKLKSETVEKQTVGQSVISSVKDVAESLGGNVKQTESELLSKLLNSVDTKTDTKLSTASLSDIMKGMKIDRSIKSAESVSRAQQVRNILNTSKESNVSEETSQPKFTRRRLRDTQQFERREKERINLFGKEIFGIFSDVTQYADSEVNKTWQNLHERDLRLAITHPPSNYFQQMILWTEQGKLWKFPIDNEQGMEEEQNVYFAEHVFLEKHLEPWCPPKGPIRHFMELVCIGLSKNPYMTVKKKQDHIAWYRDYFEDKQNLLKEVGAIPSDFKVKKESTTTEDTQS